MTQSLIIRKARLDDLISVEVQESQRFSDPRALMLQGATVDTEQALSAYLDAYSWALEFDGCALACIGIVPKWPGVACCWGLFSGAALGHPAALSRFARGGIEAAEIQLSLRRLETTAPHAHTTAHRWLRHLGFEKEGVARAYGLDGSDHILYARVH